MQLEGGSSWAKQVPILFFDSFVLGLGGCEEEGSWAAWSMCSSHLSPRAALLKGLLAVTSHSHFHLPLSP